MYEENLYPVWEKRLFKPELTTVKGESLLVIEPGHRNTASGPDFSGAKILLNGILWVGPVEIHLKTSDWLRHGHQNDPLYSNVILHVVLDHDLKDYSPGNLPVMELRHQLMRTIPESRRKQNLSAIPCQNHHKELKKQYLRSVSEEILPQRWDSKLQRVFNFKEHPFYEEEVFYRLSIAAFGFNFNSGACTDLAEAVPWKLMQKYRDNLNMLEALVLGQAGLIGKVKHTSKHRDLQLNYNFLRAGYLLNPLNGQQWKFMRTRPSNYPVLRLLQFCRFYFYSYGIENAFRLSMGPFEFLKEVFFVFPAQTGPYRSSFQIQSPGRTSSVLLLINAILPYFYLKGIKNRDEHLSKKAIEWMALLPAEKNKIITRMELAGFSAGNALESQALIELFKYKCANFACLNCKFNQYKQEKTVLPIFAKEK